MLNICTLIVAVFVPFLAYSSDFDESPIHQAGMNQDAGYFKYLIGQNLNPEIEIQGKTAFDLIKNKKDKKDLEEFYNKSKIKKASKNNFDLKKIEQVLKTNNPHIDVQNPKTGQTSMHQAIISQDISFVKLLFKYGARLDIEDYEGNKAMDYVTSDFLEEIETHLPEMLEGFNFQKAKDTLPQDRVLFAALKTDKTELDKLLTESPYLVNAKDFEGNSALHDVSVFGNPDSVRALIKHGALLNERNNQSQTPFLRAVFAENALVVKEFLNYNVQLHWADFNGRTALHLAADNMNEDLINLLLKHGVSPYVKDNLGQTPFDILKTKNPQMFQRFKAYLEKISQTQKAKIRAQRKASWQKNLKPRKPR